MSAVNQSFHVAAPTVWSALPSQLRSSSISRGQFRAGLKTHLFTHAGLRASLRTFVEERTILYVTLHIVQGSGIELMFYAIMKSDFKLLCAKTSCLNLVLNLLVQC